MAIDHRARTLPLAVRALRAIQLGAPISPRLAGRWAYRLWFRPGRFPEPAQEKEWRAGAEPLKIEHDGQQLVAHAWGEGPLVLLVHGWAGRGMQLGAFAPPLVAAGYRVVTLDLPAHGLSPGAATTIVEFSDAIQTVSRVCGVPTALIGHSFGAMCALYAVKQGLDIGRIAAIAPPARMRDQAERFFSILNLPESVQANFYGRMDKRFGEGLWERFSPIVMAPDLKLPGLVIHDEDDSDVPCQDGESVAKLWPGAQFVKTSGLGHRRILRDPDVVARVVEFVTAGKQAAVSSSREG